MRYRRGSRIKLSPKRERMLEMMQEQEVLSSILTSGVSNQLRGGYVTEIQLDTCIAQLQEAKIHFKEAERLDPYKPKPRRKKGGKK